MLERFGWNHHVHVYSLCTAFPFALWSILHFLHIYAKRRIPRVAVLRHAVVLLLEAVVPRGSTTRPCGSTVGAHGSTARYFRGTTAMGFPELATFGCRSVIHGSRAVVAW